MLESMQMDSGMFPAPQPTPPPGAPLPAPPPSSGGRGLFMAVALAVIVGLVGGAIGDWAVTGLLRPRLSALIESRSPAATQGSAVVAAPAPAGQALDAEAVAAKVDPAIVDINTVISSAGGSSQGAATGLILTSGGQVLTNNHVVDGSTSITVTIAGRSGSYTASVIGVDPSADVALIQLSGVSGLPTVRLAPAQAGEQVVALGNALGRAGTPTATQGTITGVDQSLTATDDSGNAEQLSGMLQTDANIVPGDSGGALADANGDVVGMITAGSTRGFRFRRSDAGFAVPTTTALDIVNRMRSGQAGSDIILGQPGYIGVVVADLNPAAAAQAGVAAGVAVSDVQAGSPAERAGMAGGAVITKVGETDVNSVSALGAAIHRHHAGESLTITWVDSSGTHRSTLTLVGGPAV